jgi:hypothetical protein
MMRLNLGLAWETLCTTQDKELFAAATTVTIGDGKDG